MSITRYLSLFLLLFFTLPCFLVAQRETSTTGDLVHVKLSDGLNAILMANPQASNVELIFYIKAGSMYESDSLAGASNLLLKIFSQKIALAIKMNKNGLSTQNTTFTNYTTTERGVYKFVTSTANINQCISLMSDSVFMGKIYKSDIVAARNIILQQIEDNKHDTKKIFEEKLLRGLYMQDHQKLEVNGNPRVIKELDRSSLLNFFNKYYVSNNTFVTATGSINPQSVEDALESSFKNVPKSEFNPESVTKIVDLRPMTYNTQFVVEDTTSAPEFQICWQFPGTNSNFHESYPAYLLNALLNDKNNYIQIKVAKMGCKKFNIDYEANNFNGILRVTLQPSKQNLYSTYQFVMNEFSRLNKTMLNDMMVTAGKIQFKREYEVLKKTKDYPKWTVDHWSFNDESYFPDLKDSIMAITPGRLETFIIAYFNQSPHITGLRISKSDRKALNIDSVFTDLDQNVSKYVFSYRQNVTALEGGDNQTKLQNLLQWLKTNTDISIQVNGFSDEHEYSKSTDEDSILAFIDSMPSFHRVTSDIIKHKPTIRPELARAAKIVRYLYEHGIEAERLTGTAMMFKSTNKQEAADNMKCTFSLEKRHKSPSLYEYHYGKKKE